MSEENVEIVHRHYEAFNQGDLEGMVADMAPDFDYVSAGLVSGLSPRLYRGPEEFKRMIEELPGEFEGLKWVIDEVIGATDHLVLVSLTLRGRGRHGGPETSMSLCQLWQVRDGKLVRGRGFLDRDDALEATGFLE